MATRLGAIVNELVEVQDSNDENEKVLMQSTNSLKQQQKLVKPPKSHKRKCSHGWQVTTIHVYGHHFNQVWKTYQYLYQKIEKNLCWKMDQKILVERGIEIPNEIKIKITLTKQSYFNQVERLEMWKMEETKETKASKVGLVTLLAID